MVVSLSSTGGKQVWVTTSRGPPGWSLRGPKLASDIIIARGVRPGRFGGRSRRCGAVTGGDASSSLSTEFARVARPAACRVSGAVGPAGYEVET